MLLFLGECSDIAILKLDPDGIGENNLGFSLFMIGQNIVKSAFSPPYFYSS